MCHRFVLWQDPVPIQSPFWTMLPELEGEISILWIVSLALSDRNDLQLSVTIAKEFPVTIYSRVDGLTIQATAKSLPRFSALPRELNVPLTVHFCVSETSVFAMIPKPMELLLRIWLVGVRSSGLPFLLLSISAFFSFKRAFGSRRRPWGYHWSMRSNA